MQRVTTLIGIILLLLLAVGVSQYMRPPATSQSKGVRTVGSSDLDEQLEKPKGPRARVNWIKSKDYLEKYDRERTANGFTLVPTCGSAEVALITMEGKFVHKWNVDAARARLLPNGNIVVIHGSTWGEGRQRWKDLMPTVTEYDWDGNIVWSYEGETIAHHDLQRLENGNTLFLTQIGVPNSLRMEISHPLRRKKGLYTDRILEVTEQGEIAWQWTLYDHFDVNYCGKKECVSYTKDGKPRANRDWTHTNTLRIVPENKWFDEGDERFRPGNILTLPRRFWTPIIIEKESGKVVWQYDGEGHNGGIGAPHEAHMIEKGLPGAGNILLVDNGEGTHPGETYVIEFNPVTMETEWVYEKGQEFFNRTRGSVQRLKNGNTLISWDRVGRILEVTPEGETVWSFRVPVELTRAHRYDYDYCQKCSTAAKGL